MNKKLLSILLAPVLLTGCYAGQVTEQDITSQLNFQSTQKYELTYNLMPDSPVEATLAFKNIAADVTDEGIELAVKGVTRGKNSDYTVNSSFDAVVSGGLKFDTETAKIYLVEPLIVVNDAKEINGSIKSNYIDMTQRALDDIVEYHFENYPIYQGNVEDVQKYSDNFDYVEMTTKDGFIDIRFKEF